MDGGAAGREVVELGELLLCASEADLQCFDLAEPAFSLGLGDMGEQIVADFLQAVALGLIRPEE